MKICCKNMIINHLMMNVLNNHMKVFPLLMNEVNVNCMNMLIYMRDFSKSGHIGSMMK